MYVSPGTGGPERWRVARPEPQVPRIAWTEHDVEHVCPVQFLVLRNNKVVAIPFKIARFHRVHLLFFQWLLEEFSHVIPEVADHFIWYTMIDELQFLTSTVNFLAR